MAKEFHALVVRLRAILMPMLEEAKTDARRRLQVLPLNDVVKGEALPKPDLTPKKSHPDFQKHLERALKASEP